MRPDASNLTLASAQKVDCAQINYGDFWDTNRDKLDA